MLHTSKIAFERLRGYKVDAKKFFVDGTNKERGFIRGAYVRRKRRLLDERDSSRAQNDAILTQFLRNFFSFVKRDGEIQCCGPCTRLRSRERDDIARWAPRLRGVRISTLPASAIRIPKEVVADKTGLTGIETASPVTS